MKKLLDDGYITKRQCACLIFHKTSFLYALKNFPLNNDLLKHARVFNFCNQKSSFESAQFPTEEQKFYDPFISQRFLQIEEGFCCYSILPYKVLIIQLSEATIKTDEDGDAKIYRINILWFNLFMKK